MKRKTRARAGNGKTGKRNRNNEKTKQTILAAALKLFAKKDFYNTTARAISRKAGIAEGTLFNYFETKEDLALYFFGRETDELIGWFEGNPRMKRADLPERLFAIVQHSLERLEPYQEFIGAVYLRALAPSSKLSPWRLQNQERQLRYLRFIRDILAEAESEDRLPRLGDFGAYAFSLFHSAIITHWLQDCSQGKEQTLALLDRYLKLADRILRKGGWNW